MGKTVAFVSAALLVVGVMIFAAGSASVVSAAPIEATIQADKELNSIDERVYSHFLEHIYNSCNGGLWGELVWNRSLETGSGAQWSWENGVAKQTALTADQRLLLGAELQEATPWTDYEITLKAKKLRGREGFLILFRAAPDYSHYYWANLGGWGQTKDGIEFGKKEGYSDSRKVIVDRKCTPFVDGRVYDIRVRAEGKRFQVFVDDQLILDCTDPNALASGCAGLGTWDTAAEFSDICVKDLNGNVLWDASKFSPNTLAKSDVRFWQLSGTAVWKNGDARNSNYYLRYITPGDMTQKNFAFEVGETYDFSFWTRGNGACSLRCGEKVVASNNVQASEWTKVSGSFSVAETTSNGTISLVFAPQEGGFLDIDQISIMPRSWMEKYDGFRPDLLNAVKEIAPPTIRWPGGCYASAYRWKSGIGPQDDRVVYPFEIWDDTDVNSYGTDEFIRMCRKVGAEPILVVNVGTKQWRDRVGDSVNDVDWLTEVCEWVEYCNGSVDTKWGALRAKNGHPEPYNVKYWEIDNEVHPNMTPAAEYVRILHELVPRMKAIDPNITIIGCGSWTGNRDHWDSYIINHGGDVIDYLSTHQYDNPNGYANLPWRQQRFFESRRAMIDNSNNKHVRMFDSEWNAQSTDWRTGLYAGGILNCFERVGDTLHIATPALFLRHVSARAWDNAFINFNQASWHPAPNYVVMKLWRDNYAPTRVELQSAAPEMNGDEPIVNAVATKTEDGKFLIFKVVNNQMDEAAFLLNVESAKGAKVVGATAQVVTPTLNEGEAPQAKLSKRNTLENPNAIVPQPWGVKTRENQVEFTLPSLSAGLIRIEIQ